MEIKPATDAGINSPLLPELKPPEGNDSDGASVSGAVFNVSTSIVGAGIMSIPATLKVLGVVPAIITILLVALLSEISVEFLLRYTRSGESKTYAGVMGESFGRLGSFLLQICITITNLGCLIIYLIIIGDVLCGTTNTIEGSKVVHYGILQEWFGIHWWSSRSFAIFFILIFVLFPLVLFKRVESLRFTSAISIFLAVVFVAISSFLAISALWEGKIKRPRLLPDLANQASFFHLFTAFPIIAAAFTFHFNVHPIGAELSKPSNMVLAVRISLILCATIYCTVGLFCYLLFGDSTMPDVLTNFDQSFGSSVGTLVNDIVRLSYAVHLILVFPLPNFSLRVNVDELFFSKSPLLASHNIRFVLLTSILLTLVYIAAIAIPNIWVFFQFLGSTTSICLAFVFPGAIVLRDVHGISTRRDRILAMLMIVVAVVTSSIAISSNIASFIRKD